MSNRFDLRRGRLAGIALAMIAGFALPAAAQAAPVGLGTADPFVVLGGTTVTNVGPSVLNGNLGVSPGTELEGFGLPAVVNGSTHATDEVAAKAQLDLTTAYDVAAGQPVLPANDLSGTDLGERKLAPGTYRYNAAALLTGALTLDAEGDPNAEFVFQIGSQLTTESASSVVLVNGASPCNVYWQVGSSADLGTTTAFQGSLMALTSISLKNGATVLGRMLARNGQVSLINNVLTRPLCATGPTTPPSEETPGGPGTVAPGAGSPSEPGAPGSAAAPGTPSVNPGRTLPGRGAKNPRPARNGTAVVRPVPREDCTEGFRATVRGNLIERVVFSLDGKSIGARTGSPFAMSMRAAPGAHQVRVRITFKDSTRARTVTMPYEACAAVLLSPPGGPSTFTG
ncbi:MAG TPA: ice-binding family protein [Solirubrobacterales bacterium]|nr:ice-binding family protein [Solirubrobacterales bacterium]